MTGRTLKVEKDQNIEKAIRMSKIKKIRATTKLIRTSKVTYLCRLAFLS
jgi:hypothetical protein